MIQQGILYQHCALQERAVGTGTGYGVSHLPFPAVLNNKSDQGFSSINAFFKSLETGFPVAQVDLELTM